MFSSQSFSSASVTGSQGYQGIRRVSRTKCVPVKIVCGADVSAATPFLSFTEYLLSNCRKRRSAYGPVTAEQVRGWIAENRANAQTLAQADGTQEWKPLAAFPALAAALRSPP